MVDKGQAGDRDSEIQSIDEKYEIDNYRKSISQGTILKLTKFEILHR